MKTIAIALGACFCAVSACLVPVSASAQEAPIVYGYWSWGGSLDMLTLDSGQAEQERLKDSGYVLNFFGNYVKGDWISSLRLGYVGYSDNGDFSQVVQNNYGKTETRSSDASGYTVGAATGRLWRWGEDGGTVGTIQGGYDLVLGSSRTIPGCTNCYEEDIDIDGGMFVKGAINQRAGSVYIGLDVTQYVTGNGLSRRIGISVTSDF